MTYSQMKCRMLVFPTIGDVNVSQLRRCLPGFFTVIQLTSSLISHGELLGDYGNIQSPTKLSPLSRLLSYSYDGLQMVVS